jgi:alkylation response protein AidB-like acyl-CoA dehydrogenase
MAYWEAGFAGICMCTTAQPLKAVVLAGNPEQIKLVADVLINGGFGAFALTEPNSGSDASALTTAYRRDGDGYVLNGRKCFVTNGPVADIFIVFATKDRNLGKDGVSAFLIPAGTPGLTVGKHEDKLGLRLGLTSDLSLNDVRVPAKNLVGQEGKGMRIALGTLNLGRLENAAIATGISRRALDEAVKYAKVRVVSGQPIIRHQMVMALLADMAIAVDASRALVHTGMDSLDADAPDARIAASIAKIFCSDSAVKVTQDAVQVFGGYGFTREYPVEKLYRDAKIFQIFEGTNQIQRIVMGRELEKLY